MPVNIPRWGIYAAAPAVVAGMAAAVYAATPMKANMPDVQLTDIAFVMGGSGIPTPSEGYVNTAESLYLAPNGFEGTAQALYTPEASGNTDVGLADDTKYIVDAVNSQLQTDPSEPIWIFGYSQSSAAAALAAQQLQSEGVDQDMLHFVLVGDSASAHGGFLNSFMDSMPPWLQQMVEPYLGSFGIAESNGLTTPDYYDTDVYTISNDGYANWPSNIFDSNAVSQAISGMFSSHIAYLGLSPEDIANATDITDATDGNATYHLIDAGDINIWDAIINAGINTGDLPDWMDFLTSS